MRAVPHLPLLWAAMAVAVPGTAAFVYSEGAARTLAGAALFLFAAVAAADLLLSRKRLEGIAVELPETIRCTKGREFEIAVRLENRGPTLPWLRYGLALPADFRALGAQDG